MKHILLTSVISLLLGISLTYLYYDNISNGINNVINNNKTINAFQVGITSNIEEASVISKRYKDSILINDNDNYRIVIALYNNEELTTIYKEYCNKNKIEVYVKKINVNVDFYNKLVKYEEIILNNKELITGINKSILNSYGESI